MVSQSNKAGTDKVDFAEEITRQFLE